MIFHTSEKASSYYINAISGNYATGNTYIKIPKGFINATFNENKMIFTIKIYVANNFFLPNDFLKGTLSFPSQEINSISFVNTYKRPDRFDNNNWNETSQIYEANVIVDLVEDNYLWGIKNRNFQIDLRFTCDSTSLSKDNIQIDSKVFQTFVSEIETSGLSFNFNLKNSSLITQDSTDIFVSSYSLESGAKSKQNKTTPISFELPKYDNKSLYIKNLFEIYVENNDDFEIQLDKITVNYNDDGKRKEVYKNLSESLTFTKRLKYSLEYYELYWDSKTNEPSFQIGTKGINFPFETFGFYKIGFYIKWDNRTQYYEVANKFNYSNFSNLTIDVKKSSIELESGFKQIYDN